MPFVFAKNLIDAHLLRKMLTIFHQFKLGRYFQQHFSTCILCAWTKLCEMMEYYIMYKLHTCVCIGRGDMQIPSPHIWKVFVEPYKFGFQSIIEAIYMHELNRHYYWRVNSLKNKVADFQGHCTDITWIIDQTPK